MGVGLISFQIINDLILAVDMVNYVVTRYLSVWIKLPSPWIKSARKFWAYFAREQSLGYKLHFFMDSNF